jgi:broad specificity phosphatase PhoE
MGLYLVRHGETAWARDRRHTGRSDIPLTPWGERQAQLLGAHLAGHRFEQVLTSPLSRARETARLAGFPDAEPSELLLEFDYGEYDGLTRAEIRARQPGWDLFRDGCPGGETAADVAARARRLLGGVAPAEREGAADVLLFGHGHQLRILAATWLGFAPDAARHLLLGTASLSLLGRDHDWPALVLWNREERA